MYSAAGSHLTASPSQTDTPLHPAESSTCYKVLLDWKWIPCSAHMAHLFSISILLKKINLYEEEERERVWGGGELWFYSNSSSSSYSPSLRQGSNWTTGERDNQIISSSEITFIKEPWREAERMEIWQGWNNQGLLDLKVRWYIFERMIQKEIVAQIWKAWWKITTTYI